MATFGDPTISEHTTVTILVKDNTFSKRWKENALRRMDVFLQTIHNRSGNGTELPELHEGDIIRNVVVTSRYVGLPNPLPDSIKLLLEEMEKKKLELKQQDRNIINTLFEEKLY